MEKIVANTNRFFILIILLLSTNFFNLYITDARILSIHIYDFVMMLYVLFILTNLWKYFPKKILKSNQPLKLYLRLSLLVFIIMASMPFRGGDLLSAFLSARELLLVLLMILGFYFEVHLKGTQFILKIINYCGVIFSIEFILRFALGIEGVFVDQYGFSFIVTALIINIEKIASGQKGKKLYFLVLFLLIGLLIQLFKSYLIATLAVIPIIFISKGSLTKNFKRLLGVSLGFLIIFFAAITVRENVFNELIDDLTEEEGAIGARDIENEIFRIPMMKKKPIFGWGFIHYDSEYGKSLGIETYRSAKDIRSKPYTLYTTDSGYLTMLIMFGFVGLSIFFLTILQIMIALRKRIKEKNNSNYAISSIALLIVFILVSVTHSPLIEDYGLIPLGLVISLTYKKYNESTRSVASH